MFELKKFRYPDFTEDIFVNAPDTVFEKCKLDGVAPDNFHAMSIFPEFFKINGKWKIAKFSRMDCVAVLSGDEVVVVEPRNLKKGDFVALGRTENAEDGIYLYANGFDADDELTENFSFRNIRSRETAFGKDYDELAEILKYEKNNGKIIWVLGPALSFDSSARSAMQKLIEDGYVHGLMAGNALATHDLEAAYMGTALGQDIYSQKNVPNGHYNHLTLINEVRKIGGISKFIENTKIDNGIICSCEKNDIPYVLCASIRDDGPLPEVIADAYEAQDRMRKMLSGATTVITMATMLHSIATGNMTPSYTFDKNGNIRQVFFYCIDSSEFTVNKLTNRGSICSKGIVTNAQDFICTLSGKLNKK